MLGDVPEDSTQCANPQRSVTWHRDVMLTPLGRGQAHMATRLARHLITIAPEQDCEFLTADISR